jgi:H+/Cl- antiporter ClcA
MAAWQRMVAWWDERLDSARLRLARPEALLSLSLLGLLTGLAAGGVILLFRLLVEGAQDALLPGQGPESYELLADWQRLLLPLLGGLLLAVLFRWGARGLYRLGVASVIERMAYHQGHFPVRGLVLQFVGAAIAIVAGHSVGREGPHVYLGAATGSLLGQRLALPNNAVRTLVGCGTAAGIAASFNTPLAGVVFALEVVMLEYTVASFIPVILAAVSATTLSNIFLGTAPAFAVPALSLNALTELLVVVVVGVLAGLLSALFTRLVRGVAASTHGMAIWWRMLLAGAAMGAFGWAVPGVMGIGYDTVELALQGNLAIALLAVLLVAKVLATAVAIGTGVPGGVIGPVLFIGAVLGALTSELVNQLDPAWQTDVGFYALLGMGAMMSASLQAPLAALTAMLELTDNPDVILPGMLAVVIAGLTANEVFRTRSLFVTMLEGVAGELEQGPVAQALRRIGVASAMDERFVRAASRITRRRAAELLEAGPVWVLVDAPDRPKQLMPAADLARYLEGAAGGDAPDTAIDLLEIPAQRLEAAPVHLRETLQQALERLEAGEGEVLYVERVTAPGIRRVYGVLTRQAVESAYR